MLNDGVVYRPTRDAGFGCFLACGRYGFDRVLVNNLGLTRIIDFVTGRKKILKCNLIYFDGNHFFSISSRKCDNKLSLRVLVHKGGTLINCPDTFEDIEDIPPDATVLYENWYKSGSTALQFIKMSADTVNDKLVVLCTDSYTRSVLVSLVDPDKRSPVDDHLIVPGKYTSPMGFDVIVDKNYYLYRMRHLWSGLRLTIECGIYNILTKERVVRTDNCFMKFCGSTDSLHDSSVGVAQTTGSSEKFFYCALVRCRNSRYVHSIYRVPPERLLDLALNHPAQFDGFPFNDDDCIASYVIDSPRVLARKALVTLTPCGVFVWDTTDSYTVLHDRLLRFIPHGHTPSNPYDPRDMRLSIV